MANFQPYGAYQPPSFGGGLSGPSAAPPSFGGAPPAAPGGGGRGGDDRYAGKAAKDPLLAVTK